MPLSREYRSVRPLLAARVWAGLLPIPYQHTL